MIKSCGSCRKKQCSLYNFGEEIAWLYGEPFWKDKKYLCQECFDKELREYNFYNDYYEEIEESRYCYKEYWYRSNVRFRLYKGAGIEKEVRIEIRRTGLKRILKEDRE